MLSDKIPDTLHLYLQIATNPEQDRDVIKARSISPGVGNRSSKKRANDIEGAQSTRRSEMKACALPPFPARI